MKFDGDIRQVVGNLRGDGGESADHVGQLAAQMSGKM
jgi:hypothetical protein